MVLSAISVAWTLSVPSSAAVIDSFAMSAPVSDSSATSSVVTVPFLIRVD